ncbi:MAG: polysaccharide deacetylase family protein [Nitrospirae bacterium]|nr:polysaccharide deacetylase family protein [Nitrospirota bacterium]MCL5285426.1 polysaccharide deacetylase family protein [Nitrospirota bacterium]
MRAALVLMYHQIVPEGASPGWVPAPLADPRYGVGQKDFVRQMAHLREEGYTILSLDSLLAPGAGDEAAASGRPAVAVTFDDGYETDWRLAAPVLSKFGIPATFFVATGHIGAPGMLTESMVAELSARPIFRIGSHGESHRFLSELSEEECEDELRRSLEKVRALTGQKEAEISAPGGRTSPRVADLARKTGYRAQATSRPGLFLPGGDPFSIPRLPVMSRHSLSDFSALLDPRSPATRRDWWVRSAKQAARAVLGTLPFGKGG